MAVPEYQVANTASDEDSRDLPSVQELAQQYLVPIDDLRSIVKPVKGHSTNVSGETFVNKLDAKQFSESRAHAFFRMLGLPVGVDEEYYNPGFPEPPGNKTKRLNINKKVLEKINKISDIREEQQAKINALFFDDNLAGSIYAYLLRFNREFGATIFNSDGSGGPYDFVDQKYDVSTRTEQYNVMLGLAKDDVGKAEMQAAVSHISSVLGGLGAGQHILRPFVVNPDIAETVMPDSKLICVPFLKTREDTLISKEPITYLLRPGIEAIIRARLTSSNAVGQDYIAQVKKYLDQSSEVTEDINDAIQIINNTSEDKNITAAIEEEISGYGNLQLKNVAKLFKLMTYLIKKLVDYQQDIDLAFQKIGWLPIPNQYGPELGTNGASSRSIPGSVGSEIDALIAALNLKIFANKYVDQEIAELGNFASPFSIQVNSTDQYTDKLNELKQYKDKISNQALEAMGNIELIMGEVSGLGLMDVLAVYYALWSMEEKYLIAMLDNDAFGRLIDEGLTSTAIEERVNGGKATLESAILEMEIRTKLVLTFMDRAYKETLDNNVATT